MYFFHSWTHSYTCTANTTKTQRSTYLWPEQILQLNLILSKVPILYSCIYILNIYHMTPQFLFALCIVWELQLISYARSNKYLATLQQATKLPPSGQKVTGLQLWYIKPVLANMLSNSCFEHSFCSQRKLSIFSAC